MVASGENPTGKVDKSICNSRPLRLHGLILGDTHNGMTVIMRQTAARWD
jgi:hypothetical protein